MRKQTTTNASQEKNNSRSTIPCKPETKKILDTIVNSANKDHIGYKIFPDDVIKSLLALWGDKLRDELQKEKTTAVHYADKFKLFWEKKYKKKVSKDQWEDMKMRGLLTKEYAIFLGETN